MEINFTTQVWKEGKMYVSYAKELDVSICGRTIKEAKENLIEAVECFLETAEEMGTLEEISNERKRSNFMLFGNTSRQQI